MTINCSHAPIDDVEGASEVKGEAKPSGDGSPEQDIKLLPQSEQRVSVSPRCTLMYARLRQQAGYMELSVKGRAEDTDDDCVLMPMASPSRERLATFSSP